ncbi:MAG: 2-oxo acid dehydrogenase subunit E2 [Anaerolineales bacterium]|nr:2-oxo acid dehydrogenase subunit E2 [Anaerolineales bacterium]
MSMEIDVTHLLQQKAQTAAIAKGVSLTSWLAHLVVNVLRHHPLLNARFDGDGLILYETVNLGLAVATAEGLVVPVLHGAERLSLDELGSQLDALAKTARAGKLSVAQISSGTFTISNLGMFGVSHFTPLVNPPQSAILGIGAAHPVITLTETGLQQMQYITFTVAADHRVVDGAAVAQFLGDLRQSIARLSLIP